NPGALARAGAKVTSNVWKRDIGDGGIENLHKGCQSDRCSDQPRICLWFPLLAVINFYCHACPFCCYRCVWMSTLISPPLLLLRCRNITSGKSCLLELSSLR